jgi:hypothetical protein
MTRKSPNTSETHEPSARPATATRIVSCPQCGGDSIYAPSNPYRPFCSQRCKNIDFGAWADESFRVPENTDPDADAHDNESPLQ